MANERESSVIIDELHNTSIFDWNVQTVQKRSVVIFLNQYESKLIYLHRKFSNIAESSRQIYKYLFIGVVPHLEF